MVAAQQLMPGLTGELDVLLAARDVCSVFQPTVDLGTGEPVALEALARRPAGSVLRLPDVLFETAHSACRVTSWTGCPRGGRWSQRWTSNPLRSARSKPTGLLRRLRGRGSV